MNPDYYSNSLSILKDISPRLASRLSFLSEPAHRIIKNNSSYLLLSQEDDHPIDQLPYANTNVIKISSSDQLIICYGIGLGSHLKNIPTWLEKNPSHHLVVIDDDLESFYWFLHTSLAHTLVQHPRCLFFDLIPGDLKNPFETIYWRFFHLKSNFTYLPSYCELRESSISKLKEKFAYDEDTKEVLRIEYEDASKEIYRHLYHNLFALDGAIPIASLKNKAINSPAIICGAGPSLSKAYTHLPALKERALVFAGGSSINALNRQGIQPHYGFGVDPNSIQLERVIQQGAFSTPFFYRSRWHHQALKSITSKKVYINGSGDNIATDWFENRFNIPPANIDGGYNVINLAIATAIFMGCSPIILVGMDLAYTNNQLYPSGVSEAKGLSANRKKQPQCWQTDINGDPIQTQHCWIRESQWIQSQAQTYDKIQFYNATSGGMPIPDIPNITIDKLFDLLPIPFDSDGYSKQLLALQPLDISKKSIYDELKNLLSSLEKSLGLVDTLIQACKKNQIEIDQSNENIPFALDPHAIMVKNQLESQDCYEAILQFFLSLYQRTREYKMAQIYSMKDSKEKELQVVDFHLQTQNFIKRIIEIHQNVLQDVLKDIQ